MKKLLIPLLIMTIAATAPAMGQKNANPLMQEWNTPHQTPPFNQIKNEHYKPAMRAAIKEAKANIDKITKQKAAPTFENTILAMENASKSLERISAVMYNINECCTDQELQKIVMDLSPEMTRFSNSVSMNEKLFARVKAVYNQRNSLGLSKEEMKVLENTYKSFIRSGALLDGDAKKAYAKNSEELSMLSIKFNQNVLADNNDFTLQITKEEELSGLPANVVAAAREEAQRRNVEGWVFTLAYPSYGPFMTYADKRVYREMMWRAYNSRGNRGNATDNNEIVRRITQLRYEQAKLLGYKDYASYVLDERMAQNTNEVSKFIEKLLKASFPFAKSDLQEVQNYAASKGFTTQLQRWDFSYWSEKLKQEKYNFDEELLRPYFQLEKVRQGIFGLYGKLYNLTFTESKEIQVYHPDVKAFEVKDGDRFMGILYLDMFPRESKRSGAWMTEFRGQHKENGKDTRPLIQVVCNFSKPVGDTPALLSFDEVETFMHEFGHAMHGMLSDVEFESLSGTNVYRDFVELPSQVMENWCREPQFLNTFAKHYITGDTIPGDYIEKIKRSENYLAGYLCLRQLTLGMVDMAFHTLTAPFQGSVEQFEHEHTVELLPIVPGGNTSTAFTHIFSGGYAAGYYSYKWAEVLDADAFSMFKKNGIFDKATATKFRNEVLSRGGTEHPAVLFRNFMGREPNPNALLERSGFLQQVQLSR